MKKRKSGSLSFIILTILEKAVDGVVRANDYAYHSYIYAAGYDRPLKKSALSQAINRLKNQGLITQESTNETEIILKLTKSGRQLISIENFDETTWDGKWRVVIFDIPEQKRIIRNLFRRNLKKWGFKNLQKSVWISKKDCFEELSNYINDLGLEKWVMVFETAKFSPQFNNISDRTIY